VWGTRLYRKDLQGLQKDWNRVMGTIVEPIVSVPWVASVNVRVIGLAVLTLCPL
jgi:hypothetical protein